MKNLKIRIKLMLMIIIPLLTVLVIAFQGITKINITKGDGYMNIEVHGHNEDSITCAGISAIIQTCELGLKALAENRKNVIIKEYEQDICDM